MKQKTQTFNDGIVGIYEVKNISSPGNKAKKGLTYKVGPFPFEERTVGISRFYTAMQEQIKIGQLIRTPRNNTVSPQDITIISGKQYEIKQVQYPKDVTPPSMDLSLERLVAQYDIE